MARLFRPVRHITMLFLNVAVSMTTLTNSMVMSSSGLASAAITPETGDDYMIDLNDYDEDLDAAAAEAEAEGPVFAAIVDQNPHSIQAPNETHPSPSSAASNPSATYSSAAAAVPNITWIRFGAKEFTFVMDASRRSDSVRADAHAACRDLASISTARNPPSRGPSSGVRMSSNGGEFIAGLAAIETEEELEFVSDEIRRRVVAAGQEFAHEQWWTAGRSLAGRWVWDVDGHPSVRLSVLKRSDVPKRKKGSSHLGPLISYLALSFGPEKQGWRLRVVPETFHLRFICQRVLSFTSPSSLVLEDVDRPLQGFLYSVARRMRSGNDILGGLSMNFSIPGTIELDEFTQSTCINAAITASWTDSRVAWNARLYNMTTIYLSASRIWTPYVALIDQYTGEWQELDALRGERALVTSGGHVMLRAGVDLCAVRCSTDRFWNFPFDRWSCAVDVQMTSVIPVDISASFVTSRLTKSTLSSKSTSLFTVVRYVHRLLACPSHVLYQSTADTLHEQSASNISSSTCVRLEINVVRTMPLFYLLTISIPVGLCSLIAVCLLASNRCQRHRPNHRQSATHGEQVFGHAPYRESCCSGHRCVDRDVDSSAARRCGWRSASPTASISSLMTTTLVLAFYMQFVCGHVIGLERATSMKQLPLVVLYIVFIMILLMTSSCLRLIRASSTERRQSVQCLNHRQDDTGDLAECEHRHANDEVDTCCHHSGQRRRHAASKSCDDKCRQLGVDTSVSAIGEHCIDGCSKSARDAFRRSTTTTIDRDNGDRKWQTYRSASFSESSSTSRLSRNDITSPTTTTNNIDGLNQVMDERRQLGPTLATIRHPQPPPPPPPSSLPWPQSTSNRRHRQVSFGGCINGTERLNIGNRSDVYSLEGGVCDEDLERGRRSVGGDPCRDENEIERWTRSPSKTRSNDCPSTGKLNTDECRKSAMSECDDAVFDNDARKTDSSKSTGADCNVKCFRERPIRTRWWSVALCTSEYWSDRTTAGCTDDVLALIGFVMFIGYVIAVIVGLIGH